jgi:hypothetical protein
MMAHKNLTNNNSNEIKSKFDSIECIYEIFFKNINNIKFYFDKFGNIAYEEDEKLNKERLKILHQTQSELNLLRNDVKKMVEEKSSLEKLQNIITYLEEINQKTNKHLEYPSHNFTILSEGTFLILNNYFEYLISDLLKYYYKKFRESLNNEKFNTTIKELNGYETVQEITEHLILKHVENLIFKETFDEVLNHFEKKLGVSTEQDLVSRSNVFEIRERRHLIVHNASTVNSKYIQATKNPYRFQVGDKIPICEEYFTDSWLKLKLAGQLLIFNCWFKWDKCNIDKLFDEILNRTFEDLKSEYYENVCVTCEYSIKFDPKNESQENSLLSIKFNHAIALKKLGDKKKLKKLLKEIKVGTTKPIYRVAHSILSDNNTSLKQQFYTAIINNEIDKESYLEWSLFDFVRDKKELNTLILKLFEEQEIKN